MRVDFESAVVNLMQREHQSAEFLRVNPAGKVPVLVDGDRVIHESVAICLYLADKYPDRQMIPADLGERADFWRWLLFVTTEIEQPLWRITRQKRLYAEQDRSPGDVPVARRECAEMLGVFETYMQGRAFVAGTRVSVADFVTAWTLDWANEEDLLGDRPSLRAYLEHMYARPQAVLRIAQAFALIGAAA
jgi:glutathione S-transferase